MEGLVGVRAIVSRAKLTAFGGGCQGQVMEPPRFSTIVAIPYCYWTLRKIRLLT